MSIPSQTDMFKIVLDNLEEHNAFTRKEICEKIANIYKLTEEEKSEFTSSGSPVYKSRVSWAVSYLSRAGLIDRLSRGSYILSESGKDLQNENVSYTEFASKLKNLIYSNNPWNKSKSVQASNEKVDEDNEQVSPQEEIDIKINEINESLSSELLENVLNLEPVQFEQLVVELIEKIGYGHGEATQYSHDGGIDGVLTTDQFGFDPILTQAKLYKPDNKVSRPEIQKFAGAMNNCTKGVFVTSSSFTKDAIEFADSYTHAKIKLVDGDLLTSLMIKYNLGVSTQKQIFIKRLDSDYFEN